MLPTPSLVPERFAALLSVLDGSMVSSKTLGARWDYSDQHLANMRANGTSKLPWLVLPTGGVRYRTSEIVGAELTGTRGPLTLERLALEMSAMPDVPEGVATAIIDRLTDVLRGT